MKRFEKIFLSFLAFSLVIGCLSSTGWAGDKWVKDDPVGQGWGVMDLIFARPFGVAAGIVGTGIFIVSLPFTIPAGGGKRSSRYVYF